MELINFQYRNGEINMKEVLTIQEIAIIWNVSEHTVLQWCINDTIHAVQINNEWGIYSNQSCPFLNTSDFKLQGLEKAVEDFNNWNGIVRIYFELENRFVWTSLYLHEHEDNGFGFLTEYEIYNKGLNKDNILEITKEQLFMLCYDHYLLNKFKIDLEKLKDLSLSSEL